MPGRAQHVFASDSWQSALAFAEQVCPHEPVAEVQVWSHGKWGRAIFGKQSLDREALRARHSLFQPLTALKARLAPGALVWFRTCETLGAAAGHDFAGALADFMGCAVAGHSFVIGYWQSGLHRLEPGNSPHWPVSEGLAQGSPERPELAHFSTPSQINTISCLSGRVPLGW